MTLQLKRTHPPRNIPWEERPWPAQLAIWTVTAVYVSLAWWLMFHVQQPTRRGLFWIVAAIILASSLSLSMIVARSSSEAMSRRRVLALCLSLLINTSLLLGLSRVSVFAKSEMAQRVEQKKKLEDQQQLVIQEAQQLAELLPVNDASSNVQVPEEKQPLRTGDPSLEDRDLVARSSVAASDRPEQETDSAPESTPAIKPQLIDRQQLIESAPRQFDSEGLLSAQRQQAEPRLGLPRALDVPEPVSPERPMPSLSESSTEIERIGARDLVRSQERAIPNDAPEAPERLATVLPERNTDASEPRPNVADAATLAKARVAPSPTDAAVVVNLDRSDPTPPATLTAPRPADTEPARTPVAESPSSLASGAGALESPPAPLPIAPSALDRATTKADPQQITANLKPPAARTTSAEPTIISSASTMQSDERSTDITRSDNTPNAAASSIARVGSLPNRSDDALSPGALSVEFIEIERSPSEQATQVAALPRLRTSEDRPANLASEPDAARLDSNSDQRTERPAPSSLATPVEVADALRPAADEDQFQPEPKVSPEAGHDQRLSDTGSSPGDNARDEPVAGDADASDASLAEAGSRVAALDGPAAVRRAKDALGAQAAETPDVNSVAATDNTSSGATKSPRVPASGAAMATNAATPAAGSGVDAPENAASLQGAEASFAASLDRSRRTQPSPSGASGNGVADEPSDEPDRTTPGTASDTTLSLSDSLVTREGPLPRRHVAQATAAEGPPQIVDEGASSTSDRSQRQGQLAARTAPSISLPAPTSIADTRSSVGTAPSDAAESAVNSVADANAAARPPANSVVGRAAIVPPSLESTPGPAASGGLEVDLPAVEGVGGFGPQRSVNLGVLTRKSQVESTQVVEGLARFIRRDSGGRVSVTTHAPLPAQAYRNRLNRRGDAAERGDDPGAERTEHAIELGLGYLTTLQAEDGSWSLLRTGESKSEAALSSDADSESQPVATLESQTAATGLALLSYLGAGFHHQSDQHAETVRRGLDWLVQHQKNDGDLYVAQDRLSNRSAWLYSHGIAAIALCEAYGMTQDPQLRKPAQKAVDFIVISQHRRLGGWRYEPATGSDTSVSGWMVMALRSAELANLDVPPETWERVGTWLDLAQESSEHPERYRYNPLAPDTPAQRHGRAPTKTITAVGLLMRLYLGWGRDQEEMKRGADVLVEHLPEMGSPGDPQRDTYYWYYATQVMFHMRGEHWAKWNAKLHPLLTGTQEQSGPLAGSWNPRSPLPDRWAVHAGRLYVTTLNLLSLEVNYRHLPIYEDMQRETLSRRE